MGAAQIVWTVVIIAVVIAYFVLSIRIVRPFQQGVVERFGKYRNTRDAGFHMIIPFVDRMTRVDMRENVVDVPSQEVITKDNVAVTVDAVVYYQPIDAVKLIYNVTNFYLAATKLAQTNLRNVVGEMQLDETLTSRESINNQLRDILYKATERWGVEVVRVELQRIEPPADVTQSMHRQMKAERERRATIIEAEGERQASIERAEGVKQSSILEAEGKAQAMLEVASAERKQEILRSEGQSQAITNVMQSLDGGEDVNSLIAIRYLESLKSVADGNATKIIMPMEMSGMAGSVECISEMFQSGRVTPAVKAREGAAEMPAMQRSTQPMPPMVEGGEQGA